LEKSKEASWKRDEEIAAQRSTLKDFGEERENLKDSNTQLKTEVEKLKEEKTQLESERDDLKSKLDTVTKEKDELSEKYAF